jgi:hypothetical protein
VRALSSDARYAPLHELVTVFAQGSLSDYTALVGRHGALLPSLGVDTDKSAETMRLFTLVSLASGTPVLETAAVARALQVRASGRGRGAVYARAGRGPVDGK